MASDGAASSRPSRPPGIAVVLGIFVLSGAAGLIDEIVWSRQLVLVFGNTTQAVSAILTGFFGGMAIGAVVGGRLADRVRRPLRLYAGLELVLAAVVIATPLTFRLIDDVYRGIYPALEGSPQALALVRMALAVLALAPATVLMGATLPTLTRQLTREGHLSAAFGRLYAANTIGAIVGTLAAGLVLIELLGLSGALAVGAGCSALAGVAALALAWRTERRSPSETTVPGVQTTATVAPLPSPTPAGRPDRTRLALTVAFVSGFTTLGYQVLWTRLLASGTGNTTYVFTIILVEFLVGLAIGALLFGILRQRMREPARVLAGTQILAGLLVLVGLVGFIGQPHQIDPLRPFGAVTMLIGIGLPVVLLTTVVLGLSFPSASTLLAADRGHTARNTGTFLAINTVGSIAGSFLVPFLLIPIIGSPHAAALLALINVALGLAIAVASPELAPARRTTVAVGAVAGVIIVAAAASPGALVSGDQARLRALGVTVYATAEDEIATVEAGEEDGTPKLWVAGTSMTVPTVDVRLMPLLPLIARPAATDALIVAFGMGSSFRSAIVAGLSTDAAELVPSVPGMFGYYYLDAAGILADPAARVIVADGRNHLELTDKAYDIIVTDPPPPVQSSGASVISSLEYYEVGRRHLKPHGIMLQWLPFTVSIDELKPHIRTFASVFPDVTIVFGPAGYGMYMLGSDQAIAFDRDSIRAVLERPGVLDDISSAFDSKARSIADWTRQIDASTWLSGPAVTAFAGDGPLVTDDRPLSEYFLLRTWRGDDSPAAGPATLRAAAQAGH